MTNAQVVAAMFGRRNGGVPREVREHLGFASAAINAYARGLSLPRVALAYRYEPVQALMMIATCCGEYGFAAVASLVPRFIMSMVQVELGKWGQVSICSERERG